MAAKRLAVKAKCHTLLYGVELSAMDLKREDEDQTAVLVQTSSGTTGDPKVICRDWDSIDEELESYTKSFTLPQEMTPIIACPVTHSYGLIAGVLVAMRRGQHPIIVSNINPKYLLKKLLTTPSHLLYSSPALLNSVVQLYPNGQKLHAVMTSGTVLPQSWFDALKAKAQFVFQQYGCSEAGCIAINPQTESANQIGKPLPHLMVTAGENIDAPAEIVVTKGELVIYTQDIGYVDPSGQLCFVSRSDDMINVSGLNVYPQDVENVVMEIPEVSDAVVFKRADSLSGERVCLQFVADINIEPSRIRHWCSTRLASFQLPIDVEQRDAIEKMPNGKVNRKALSQSKISLPALG
ncbi:AMP-binding protein [Enterovibrio coralii]|uniref:AMP-binding protein n=1 Tax=Enterovibrio coralii TaxID=294935 RepID=UPI001E3FD96E|nr:AMP-binding protein [Enterovibrio coralii]